MKEKRSSNQAKYGEVTKVVRLPESLANFLQQYPSVISELVSQIKDGALNLSIDVTALQPVTNNLAYDFESMINQAIAPLLARLESLESVRSEATATERKAPNTIPESEDDSNPEITGNSPETDALPIIEAIETIEAPMIEKSATNQITYRLNRDGSVVLRSLVGTSIKVLKRMRDDELKAIGLFRTLIGANEKFFPIDPDAIAATDKPKSTKKQSTKVDTGKRFTSIAAAAYYRQKTGQPLKETTLIANAKKYGFVIKEKGSGLYALIDES